MPHGFALHREYVHLSVAERITAYLFVDTDQLDAASRAQAAQNHPSFDGS